MSGYVVTGGAGFIGSALVRRLLSEGVGTVTVIDNLLTGREENLDEVRSSVEWHRADIRNYEEIAPLVRESEVVFHLAAIPSEQVGWLAGLRDPMIARTLALMHGKPAYNWTIEELAKQAGLSRSVMAERFTQLVGLPPMHYLAKWRMQIASELLTSSNANIARIAAETGYGSEESFSRAFKKMVGVAPSVWRRRNN